ncbi:MAG: tRNA pseudouridine(38-40) synthase TruA [Thermoplasmatota archaeon]
MQRVALRVGYLGSGFAGSQRQPKARTVDGALIDALRELGSMGDFRPASRTDRGVHATGYVVAFDHERDGADITRRLIGQFPDLWCTAWAPAPRRFDPRRAATGRRYRYTLPWPNARDRAAIDSDTLARAFGLFEGTHDFSAFARVEKHRTPQRTVREAGVTARRGSFVFDVEGPSFLWNQVRRMVAAAVACARGERPMTDIARALSRPDAQVPDFGIADPAGLCLTEVRVPLSWTLEPAALAYAARALDGRVENIRAALGSLELVREGLGPGRSARTPVRDGSRKDLTSPTRPTRRSPPVRATKPRN